MSKHVKTLLDSLFTDQNDWKITLLKNWNTILGDITTKVHLEKIHDDILTLAVNDACWLQELYLLSPILLQKINQSLDSPRIKQLRFKQAGREKQKKLFSAQPVKKFKPHVLSITEQKALSSIKDPELGAALKQFLTRCYQEQD